MFTHTLPRVIDQHGMMHRLTENYIICSKLSNVSDIKTLVNIRKI